MQRQVPCSMALFQKNCYRVRSRVSQQP
eukprot:symbB.v1.2.041195.t1/scaffold7913.1/size8730/1